MILSVAGDLGQLASIAKLGYCSLSSRIVIWNKVLCENYLKQFLEPLST